MRNVSFESSFRLEIRLCEEGDRRTRERERVAVSMRKDIQIDDGRQRVFRLFLKRTLDNRLCDVRTLLVARAASSEKSRASAPSLGHSERGALERLRITY